MNSVHSVLKSMYSYTIYFIEKKLTCSGLFLDDISDIFFLCSFFDHQIMRGFYVHFVYLFFFIHCVVLYIIRIFIISWLIQSLWSLFFNFKQLTYVVGGGGGGLLEMFHVPIHVFVLWSVIHFYKCKWRSIFFFRTQTLCTLYCVIFSIVYKLQIWSIFCWI